MENNLCGNITARELYDRVGLIADSCDGGGTLLNHLVFETLQLVCQAALRGERHAMGGLITQVDKVCTLYHLNQSDRTALQAARRQSKGPETMTSRQALQAAGALARLVSTVFGTAIPAHIVSRIPHFAPQERRGLKIDLACVRCIVRSWDDQTIVAEADIEASHTAIEVDIAHCRQFADLSYLPRLLREGMQLNLLDCEQAGRRLVPRLVVVEPDYLIDISALAACFEDYGHHPLLYTVNRMKAKPNTRHTVLGNFAGSALDDIINNPRYDMQDTVRSNFREKAMEYATCEDLDPAAFKAEATRQVENIRLMTADLFRSHDRRQALLEPSFVCEKLGLQGRVDLLTTDLRLLVEQKSGRSIYIERNFSSHGAQHLEKHFVQMLLYLGVLRYNFGVSKEHVDSYLMYSRYPLERGLIEEHAYDELFYEAIKLRNRIVAGEYCIAQEGMEALLPALTPAVLNTAGMQGYFYETFLRPQLEAVTAPLQHLTELEQAYFCRMMRFVTAELVVAKTGGPGSQGTSMADLWSMPTAEKRDSGNIYTGLTISRKERSSGFNGYDTLTLSVPAQGSDFLPNFRPGDMVYLYAYPPGQEPDVRKSFLYKAVIEEIHTATLKLHLTDGQQNPDVIERMPLSAAESKPLFAIEHAGSDAGGSSAVFSLHELMTASQPCRDLLLGQREPRRDASRTLTRSYSADYDDMLLHAKQALDYFLLVGPPGTGKTSMALQYMVREALASRGSAASLLLMSYTNRAVDEICDMLVLAGINFIRIGNEFSCDPKFRSHLIGSIVAGHPTLQALRERMLATQVIVSTTSMLVARPFIFALKRFDLAIIDEASQILEPNIIGLLASHHPSPNTHHPSLNTHHPSPITQQNIAKFILIGDYKQLPAVVQQSEEESAVSEPVLLGIGLDNCRNSLFERLIRTEQRNGRTDFIGILRKQGRMHPEIAEFPNRMFYFSERLEPVPLVHQLETELPYTLPAEDETDVRLKNCRLLFIPSATDEPAGTSDKVNEEEAAIVADMLRRIHRFYGQAFDADRTVGVIVPYRNQIAMIRKHIERLGTPQLERISIDTVERYQGSQRDIIIYSFTIKHLYQLDFLTANSFVEAGHTIDRKLNVAITRARKQLILTGNPRLLGRNALFAALIAHIRQRGGYINKV